MADTDWRDFSAAPLPPLLMAALRAFVRSGYHGTTIRGLAAEAGLSVPGLYHHYPSKQAILTAITSTSMADLMRRSLAAIEEAGADPRAQLDRYVECMVLFHAHYRDLAFIAATEIRSLESPLREEYIAARDAQERLLREIVARGIAQGSLRGDDPRVTVRALITMCTGVSQWFDPRGPQAAGRIAEQYVELARRAFGVV